MTKLRLIESGTKFGNLVVIERAENQDGRVAYKCKCINCGSKIIVRGYNLKSGQKGCQDCKKKLIEIGARFGDLIVIERVKGRGRTIYKCQCECGNFVKVRANQLRKGQKNCRKCRRRKPIEVGGKFGSLVVIERMEYRRDRHAVYKCQCSCGNFIDVNAHNLRYQKSCRNCVNRLSGKGKAGFNALFGAYKRSAEKRRYVFELTKDEFRKLVTNNCTYCGIPPSTIKKTRYEYGNFIYNGIDRMDNDLGYVPGNVATCCKRCNRAKGTRNYNEWIAWLDRIAEFRTRKTNKGGEK